MIRDKVSITSRRDNGEIVRVEIDLGSDDDETLRLALSDRRIEAAVARLNGRDVLEIRCSTPEARMLVRHVLRQRGLDAALRHHENGDGDVNGNGNGSAPHVGLDTSRET